MAEEVNQGILAQINNNNTAMNVPELPPMGAQMYEEFHRAMREYAGELQFQEGDSEPRRINPRPAEAWYHAEEERELRNFMSQQRTAARLEVEQNIEQTEISLVEELKPLQDHLNVLQYKNQVAIVKGEKEAVAPEGIFLGNIEK